MSVAYCLAARKAADPSNPPCSAFRTPVGSPVTVRGTVQSVAPLLILQDLRRVSSGITQGPPATSLSAQLETLLLFTIRTVLSAFPTGPMEEPEPRRSSPSLHGTPHGGGRKRPPD